MTKNPKFRYYQIIDFDKYPCSDHECYDLKTCHNDCESCTAFYGYGWIDEVGGTHEDGLGVNPQEIYCGECTRESCNGCRNQHIK